MSAFFNRVEIKGDIAHGTRIYLDGMELKELTAAKLELEAGAMPLLTVTMAVDKFDTDLAIAGEVRNAEEDEP